MALPHTSFLPAPPFLVSFSPFGVSPALSFTLLFLQLENMNLSVGPVLL